MQHKIALISFTYNEEKFIPFVIDYWKRFVSHAYVFDNGSTDNTKKLLSQYDWISIIDYSHLTGNKLDDELNMDIKNNFWKTIKNKFDWVVVCDFDECLYSNNWDQPLSIFEKYDMPYIIPAYYNMINMSFPEYKNDRLYHEDNKYYIIISEEEEQKIYSKLLLFNCKTAYELNLAPGSHSAGPLIIRNNLIQAKQQLKTSYIQCYHLRDIGGPDYFIAKKNHNVNERQTEYQVKHRYGIHYHVNDEEVRNNYNNWWENKLSLK